MNIRSERVVDELSSGALTVRKSALDLEREGVYGVKLELSTAADQALDVRLAETFPGHFSMGDVQVHPSHHPGRWTTDAAGHRLVLETEVEPAATFETIYGFRAAEDDLEGIFGTPEVVSVEALGGGHEVADFNRGGGSSTDSTASVSPGSRRDDEPSTQGPAEPSSPAISAPEEPPASSDSEPPSDAEAEPAERGADGPDTASVERPPAETSPDTAHRIEDWATQADRSDGSSPTDDRPAEAGFAFGEDRPDRTADGASSTPTPRGRAATTEASRGGRGAGDIDLEARLDELSAVTRAFDEVVDVVGSSAQAVVALGGAHEALADDVDELSTRTKAAAGDRDALRRRVETLEAAVEELRDHHAADVGDLDARLAELEETFVDSDEFAAIREVVAAERAWRERSSRSPGGLTATPGASNR